VSSSLCVLQKLEIATTAVSGAPRHIEITGRDMRVHILQVWLVRGEKLQKKNYTGRAMLSACDSLGTPEPFTVTSGIGYSYYNPLLTNLSFCYNGQQFPDASNGDVLESILSSSP
jgi:hypothetical protein